MKKQFFYLLTVLCLAVSFTSCDKGDDPKDPENTDAFSGYDNEKLDQEIFADETDTEGGFAFTASEAWNITINEVTKSTADNLWVTVDQMNGDAGTHTITIKLDLNYTGEDRMAKINIKAGKSKITITVKQKGTTEENVKPTPEPKLITSIKEDKYNHDGSIGKHGISYSFEYDSDSRLSKMQYSWNDGRESDNMIYYKSDFTYQEDKIIVNEVVNENNPDPYRSVYEYTLNSDGKMTSARFDDLYYEDDYVTSLSEYRDGLLYKLKNASFFDANYSKTDYVFNWNSGNLASFKSTTLSSTGVMPKSSSNSNKLVGEFDIIFDHLSVKNITNIDFYAILESYGDVVTLDDGTLSMASLIRISGRNSTNLVNKQDTDRKEFSYTTIEGVEKVSIRRYKEKLRYEYLLDSENYPITIKEYVSRAYPLGDSDEVGEFETERISAIYTITYNK